MASGVWQFDEIPVGGGRISLEECTGSRKDVEGTSRLLESAAASLLSDAGAIPGVKKLAERVRGRNLNVTFYSGHDVILDVTEVDPPVIGLDVGMARSLADAGLGGRAAVPDTPEGLQPLLVLACAFGFGRAAGNQDRECLHIVADIFEAMHPQDRRMLQAFLRGCSVDSGNIFSEFLRRGSNDRRWDRWITWLRGQFRVDLPYSRESVVRALEADLDPDARRSALFGAVRDYDPDIERGNIQRICVETTAAGEELVFGRMSRAFHDQAMLLADARLVTPGAGEISIVEDIGLASEKLPGLAPHVDRLRSTLDGTSDVSLTCAVGAVERLEEEMLNVQRSSLETALSLDRKGLAADAAATRGTTLSAVECLLDLAACLRARLLALPARRAAYVVISQRPSPSGAHLLARINEFEEPYLGKPEDLRTLVDQAGDRVYSSPDYRWLRKASHWIEAIPLFIKERVIVVDGAETTETVIDQEGMEESFREEMAAHWALNIEEVRDLEYVSVAREMIFRYRTAISVAEEEAAREFIVGNGLQRDVAELAASVSLWAASRALEIAMEVEKDGIDRYEAVRRAVLRDYDDNLDAATAMAADVSLVAAPDVDTVAASDVGLVAASDSGVAAAPAGASDVSLVAAPNRDSAISAGSDLTATRRRLVERLLPLAGLPRRPQPTLHVLTTQSARMTEGYIKNWLEESMALFNVVRSSGLDGEVATEMAGYRERTCAFGQTVIDGLGIGAEVEEIVGSERVDRTTAVLRVIGGSRTVQEELSRLAVLRGYAEANGLPLAPGYASDPDEVEEVLRERRGEFLQDALQQVEARNRDEIAREVLLRERDSPGTPRQAIVLSLVEERDDYSKDLDSFLRFAARKRLVAEIDQRDSQAMLADRVSNWLRDHQRLARTTAAKTVVSRHGLNHLCMHPFYDYQASGGKKGYNLLYTPSRVDLGRRERESVEKWAQWVGGLDGTAGRVGRRFYGLINKSVRMYDSLAEPELLKTGENASMVSHFAFANALALMVNATGRGDAEDMGYQMGLRGDRIIHPAGEGYGGYCVPKDGLFLEFVLMLSQRTKLRQLGIPAAHQDGVVSCAKAVLAARDDFPTAVEWEAWAAQRIATEGWTRGFFNLREGRDGEPVPVFQLTKIALALGRLGRARADDSADRIVTSLSAQWGIHKIVVGGEQINRFMPFYKAWMTRRIAERARPAGSRRHPEDLTIVVTAEYKPDTQDGRFSVGMRKFEILSGAFDHLVCSLDGPGQDLALLMHQGFSSLSSSRRGRLMRLLACDPADEGQSERLRQAFPGYPPPGELRVVSTMGLSTEDLLHYTSDTSLESLAEEARQALLGAGLTDTEIWANVQTYGARVHRYAGLDRAAARRGIGEIAGALHALALKIRGPERDYEGAVQGADVLDVGIPHESLLSLLSDPGRLRDLMLLGNPLCALAIVDGASGARRRAMTPLGVMRWFAAAERMDRSALYSAIGVGEETVEAWRAEMRRRRGRAELLFEAVQSRDSVRAASAYGAIRDRIRSDQEAGLATDDEEKLVRFGRSCPADRAVTQALCSVAGGLPIERVSFVDWLALGGMFVLDGEPPELVDRYRRAFAASSDESVASLIRIRRLPRLGVFRQEKQVESSNKATEERIQVALDTRRELADRAARANSLCLREEAFREAFATASRRAPGFDECFALAMSALGDGAESPSPARVGEALGAIRAALVSLAGEVYPAGDPELDAMVTRVDSLLAGREVDLARWKEIAGGYEDIGDFGRLSQRVIDSYPETDRPGMLERVAMAGELFYIVYAVEITADDYRHREIPQIWRDLASFFAETLNDHFYEYRPWVYSRGIGFETFHGEDLYRLAVDRHRWLYRRLRAFMVTATEVGDLSEGDRDLLLGNFLDGKEVAAVGAGGRTYHERAWRAYGQLREIAFIRNDGFPLPAVFEELDPDIFDAEGSVNQAILLPVGRTHYSRVLIEGPTLAHELRSGGRRPSNLIITRDGRFRRLGGDGVDVLELDDGHLCLSAEQFAEALVRHRGLSRGEAQLEARNKVASKGIRVAARFSRPVLAAVAYPFHGHPKYTSGALEDLGLPYSVQSLFHTWTTYDKSKYPDIFPRESGVELPDQIDWLHGWTVDLADEEEARRLILDGEPRSGYPGLRAFASRHRIVMVKDAAESGGRGQKAFSLREIDRPIDERELIQAADFVYQISLKHNVAIQEVIISSPEYWATEDFLRSFVDRQIVEWGSRVERNRHPRTPIYGSHRIIVSTDDPARPSGPGKWHVSHCVALNSKQLITNVGRGGTLEEFRSQSIREEFRDAIMSGLILAGELVMEALSQYELKAGGRYEIETGRRVGRDLTGVSYGMPRYMMLDFLIAPVFREDGEVVDVEPRFDSKGERVGSKVILQEGGRHFEGTIADWRVVLIEPNIGVGLWDRLAIREEVLERETAACEGREMDWHAVGRNGRTVVRDLAKAGQDYLEALAARAGVQTNGLQGE